MTFTSIILILLSAFCHALWNFYSKSSRDTRVLFFWCGFYTVAIAFIAFGTKHPVIPRPVWIYIIASALVHLLYRLFLTHAYTVGEISFVYPIARAAPAFFATVCLSFLKRTNFGTRFGRYFVCDGIYSTLSTTRGAYSVHRVPSLPSRTGFALGLCDAGERHRVLTDRQAGDV